MCYTHFATGMLALQALSIVREHWTFEEYRSTKDKIERLLHRRLHADAYFLHLEAWRNGHDTIFPKLSAQARWLAENGAVVGVCQDCGVGVTRSTFWEDNSFLIECKHSACRSVNHVFIRLFEEEDRS